MQQKIFGTKMCPKSNKKMLTFAIKCCSFKLDKNLFEEKGRINLKRPTFLLFLHMIFDNYICLMFQLTDRQIMD